MNWMIEKDSVFLNHGSFGACPEWILKRQQAYRNRMESQPVRFLIRELEEMHRIARETLAGFVNADPEGLVFMTNATTAVNTIFRSLRFQPGDEILITSHIYPACKRLLEFICERTHAVMVEACYPFPMQDPGFITESILAKVTPRTRVALIDHITAATAMIQPVEEIVKELDRLGVDTMIDGAHTLGQIPVDIERIGAAYYTSNCHKWLCSPKSAAILHVRDDKRKGIVPVVISHAGYQTEPFPERFYWPATYDPTPVLCAADLVTEMENHYPGGWPAIMERNHRICLEARAMICRELEIPEPCPGEMTGSMATIPLQNPESVPEFDYKSCDPLQNRLFLEHRTEVPIWYFGKDRQRVMRISAHLYNEPDHYRILVESLKPLLLSRPDH
jgi:isopenicillin-N epimerase